MDLPRNTLPVSQGALQQQSEPLPPDAPPSILCLASGGRRPAPEQLSLVLLLLCLYKSILRVVFGIILSILV